MRYRFRRYRITGNISLFFRLRRGSSARSLCACAALPVFLQPVFPARRLDPCRLKRPSPRSEAAFDIRNLVIRKIRALRIPSEPFRRVPDVRKTNLSCQCFFFLQSYSPLSLSQLSSRAAPKARDENSMQNSKKCVPPDSGKDAQTISDRMQTEQKEASGCTPPAARISGTGNGCTSSHRSKIPRSAQEMSTKRCPAGIPTIR